MSEYQETIDEMLVILTKNTGYDGWIFLKETKFYLFFGNTKTVITKPILKVHKISGKPAFMNCTTSWKYPFPMGVWDLEDGGFIRLKMKGAEQ